MNMIGKLVVVRDNRAGVFFGTLTSLDLATKTATMANARKIHAWYGAAAVEGLAARGCGHGSRVTPTVASIALCDVIQVCECSEDGAAALAAYPEWRP